MRSQAVTPNQDFPQTHARAAIRLKVARAAFTNDLRFFLTTYLAGTAFALTYLF